MDELLVCQLGRVGYREGLALQESLRERVIAGELPGVFLLLEHDPVYTRGRRAVPGELPMGESWYLSQGIDVVDVKRGGKATYHGPGQITGYPIMPVGDLKEHVRAMERGLIAALAEEGISARDRVDEGPDYTGVWVGERKIASIGVHVRKGVATHGFAVNVNGDLQPWGWIVPCGLQVQMTSIAKERQDVVDLDCVRKRVAHRVAEQLGRRQRLVSPSKLGIDQRNGRVIAPVATV